MMTPDKDFAQLVFLIYLCTAHLVKEMESKFGG